MHSTIATQPPPPSPDTLEFKSLQFSLLVNKAEAMELRERRDSRQLRLKTALLGCQLFLNIAIAHNGQKLQTGLDIPLLLHRPCSYLVATYVRTYVLLYFCMSGSVGNSGSRRSCLVVVQVILGSGAMLSVASTVVSIACKFLLRVRQGSTKTDQQLALLEARERSCLA